MASHLSDDEKPPRTFKGRKDYFHHRIKEEKVVHQIYPGSPNRPAPAGSKSSTAFFGGISNPNTTARSGGNVFQKVPKRNKDKAPQIEAKPTVTSLLRQKQLYAKKVSLGFSCYYTLYGVSCFTNNCYI